MEKHDEQHRDSAQPLDVGAAMVLGRTRAESFRSN